MSKAKRLADRAPSLRKSLVKCLLTALLIGFVVACGCWWFMIRMPGESFSAQSAIANQTQEEVQEKTQEAQPSHQQQAEPNSEDATGKTQSPAQATTAEKNDTSEKLTVDIEHLAVTIGERNIGKYEALNKTADWIQKRLKDQEYEIRRETYQVRGLDCHNIEATLKGSTTPDEIVIVGAHYDSVMGTPGANDNGSGTAALLWLAEKFAEQKPKRTIRFVAFTNEEPPYFQTDEMGSYVYAKGCKQRDENLVAVLSLETMGYYSDEPDSQQFPNPALAAMYPSEGNFIGFIGNLGSRPLVTRAVKTFRDNAKFPSEGASLPSALPGIGWSDHWSFWQEGYQGLMITDTAPFRYPHYHKATDLPDKIDFDRLAKVVEGLEHVILDFAND